MTLKTIVLTAADRQIIQRIIARPGSKADIVTARHVREIRRRLDLRQFSKQNDKLTESLRELNLVISWDDLMDGEELFADLDELLREEEVDDEKVKLEKLRTKLKSFLDSVERTIDDSFLRWLRERLQEQEWDKVQVMVGGKVQDMTLDIHPSQYEAVADLDDKLDDAIMGDE